MGAGASSNKHRSIDAKEEMIQRLDNEQALSDAARDSFASSGSNSSDGRGGGSGERIGNGRTTSISPTIPEESTEGKRSSSPKTKRRPMPIPMHVFQSRLKYVHRYWHLMIIYNQMQNHYQKLQDHHPLYLVKKNLGVYYRWTILK
jgi:hypothetical protein